MENSQQVPVGKIFAAADTLRVPDFESGVRPDSEVAFGLGRTTTVEPQQRDREMWERLVVDEIPPDS